MKTFYIKDIPIYVDDEDYTKLVSIKWHINDGYARSYLSPTKVLIMHRLIMNAKKWQKVDHIDGNKSNNQKNNLRICTPAENSYNRQTKVGKSGYKGVVMLGSYRKWVAQIYYKGKVIRKLGFDTAKDAALCRDKMAIKYHKQFAILNFPRLT